MSTFLGLLAAGRPSPRFIVLEGLGADPKPVKARRAGGPKKAPAKAKKASSKAAAAPTPPKVIKVKGGLRNSPIDGSHHPWKRSYERPGVPRAEGGGGRADGQTGEWSCHKVAKYIQKCTPNFGKKTKRDGSPRVKIVRSHVKGDSGKMSTYKKSYNATYRKYMKKLGKPRFANKADDRYSSGVGSKSKSAAKRVRAKKAAKK